MRAVFTIDPVRRYARRASARLALLALLAAVIGCGGRGDLDGTPDGGADAAEQPPIDGGLSPDAKLEDCMSTDGIRICGSTAGCFEDGPYCDCGFPHGNPNEPQIGWCHDDLAGMGVRICGSCLDGQVCVDLPTSAWLDHNCASESLGRLLWQHGRQDLVRYADDTPYDGQPLPMPTECPPPVGGAVQLCGGNCGGCGAAKVCSGRSPTHPFGICIPANPFDTCIVASDCSPDGACLNLSSAIGATKYYPTLCVPAADCPSIAAAIPGGALCN